MIDSWIIGIFQDIIPALTERLIRILVTIFGESRMDTMKVGLVHLMVYQALTISERRNYDSKIMKTMNTSDFDNIDISTHFLFNIKKDPLETCNLLSHHTTSSSPECLCFNESEYKNGYDS